MYEGHLIHLSRKAHTSHHHPIDETSIRRWPNVVVMLDHRCRRWYTIELCQLSTTFSRVTFSTTNTHLHFGQSRCLRAPVLTNFAQGRCEHHTCIGLVLFSHVNFRTTSANTLTSTLTLNPFNPHDASKHHLTSLKTDLIFLQLRVLELKFL